MLLGALMLVAPGAAWADITVNDVEVSETNAGAGLTFTLTRSAGLLAPAVTVSFTTVDGSARAPGDYAATSGTREFPAALLGGTQIQLVNVPVVNDALDEATESLRLRISGAEITDGEGVGTITDNDAPPTVSVADAAPAPEGSNAVFTISLDAPSGRDVAVAFATADGSAVAPGDYTARGNAVAIPAGTRSVEVGVPLADDAADEPDETFLLNIGSPANATLGRASATATIVDNDAAPAAPPPAAVIVPVLPTVGSTPATGGGATSGATPRLGLSSPRLRRPATILVTISCPTDAGTCSGRVTIFSRPNLRSKIKALRRERRLARVQFALEGGHAQTLALKVGALDRKLLRRAGRMNVRAYAVTQDASGRTGVRSVNGTLIARTTHSGH